MGSIFLKTIPIPVSRRTLATVAIAANVAPLWEMRMRGRDGISRALYVAASGQRVVIVRVFVKKTQKTPSREIDLALSRAKEVLP